ncbi:MAG: biotin/lipoyl-binding protein [Candidatus Obscuribacterales bacterium]|nr:biotin/lipoyl-binding protein [Cyanobacteria bacterium SZAS LIN-5]RTL39220.1 MAG: HlyD family efflux transporter periplasmic adaptor subunit [Candidatus Melainabacteria bacterium]
MTVSDNKLDTSTQRVDYESLRVVATSRGYGQVAVLLAVLLISTVLILVYAPWQQSITGSGKIIILSPMERPQNIEAQISARLTKWFVRDGQTVKQGELIAELSDIDPKFLDPEQLKHLENQKAALTARRAAAQDRHKALEQQLLSLKQSQSAAVPSASERALQADDRFKLAQQAVEAAKQNHVTTTLNLQRMKELFEKGLRSKRDLELSELDNTRARTDLERAHASLEIARHDQKLAQLDQSKVRADTEASISNIAASLASAQETVESTSGEIFKLDVELQNLNQRIKQRKVYAPTAGRIVKLQCVGAGATVDAGTVLAVIAPDTRDLAAELTISDNDAPLVSVGRPVRLQFAGWPALQFSGWPSIAVGTFGGRVSVIDAIDDGRNCYRVIVRPDAEAIAQGRDEPWPDAKFLRPGAEVSGWIMLDTVSLGFELWRQFNSFPPTVKLEELGLHKTPEKTKSDVKRKSK